MKSLVQESGLNKSNSLSNTAPLCGIFDVRGIGGYARHEWAGSKPANAHRWAADTIKFLKELFNAPNIVKHNTPGRDYVFYFCLRWKFIC